MFRDVRPAALLPWIAAISFAAFASAAALAVVGQLQCCQGFVVSGYNFLYTFRMALPVALGFCALVGVPVALSHVVGRLAGVVASFVAVWIGVAVLVGAAEIWGWLKVLYRSVPIVPAVVLAGGPAFAFVIWLFGAWQPARTSPRSPLARRLRTTALVAMIVAPLALVAIRDASTDLACRAVHHHPKVGQYYKGELSFYLKPDVMPELHRVMQRFASDHGMTFEGQDAWNFAPSLRDAHACLPGKLIVTTVARLTERGSWDVRMRVYAPGSDWQATVGDLVSTVRTQWVHVAVDTKLQESLRGP